VSKSCKRSRPSSRPDLPKLWPSSPALPNLFPPTRRGRSRHRSPSRRRTGHKNFPRPKWLHNWKPPGPPRPSAPTQPTPGFIHLTDFNFSRDPVLAVVSLVIAVLTLLESAVMTLSNWAYALWKYRKDSKYKLASPTFCSVPATPAFPRRPQPCRSPQRHKRMRCHATMVEAVDRPTPTDTNSNPSPNPSSPTMVSPEPPVSSQVGRLFTQARSALASRVRNLLGTALPQQQDVPDGFVPIQEAASQTSAIRRVDAVTRPQEERLQNLLRDLYRTDPQVRTCY
jgi:hypothetical protein